MGYRIARFVVRWATLTLCIGVGNAGAEVAEVSPEGFHVRHVVTIDAAAASVWRGLTDPASWWEASHTRSGDPANLSLEPRAGGCFCERWDGGSSIHLEVVLVKSGRHLRLEGALGPLQGLPVRGVMDFVLEPEQEDTVTRVTFDYRVAGAVGAEWPEAVDGVLGAQLSRLSQYVEEAPPAAAGGTHGDQPSG